MNIFFGIISLIIATVEASGAPKIQIFEIRENEDGLHVKNLNEDAKNNPKTDHLVKLLRGAKADNQAERIAKQLLKKLKTVREHDKTNKYNEDAHIYLLNNDNDGTEDEDTHFFDKTRSEKDAQDGNSIKELLKQLMPSEKKTNTYLNPDTLRIPKSGLRSDQVVLVESRTSIPKRKHEYVYYDNDARLQQDEEK